MIFVTVGTQDKPFTRLIKAIEDAVRSGDIQDEVIVQSGHTKYESNVITILNYIPYEQFGEYLKKAEIIITHGGVGSIIGGVKAGKKVIAVARLAKYNEHKNDHQLQVIDKMEQNGYILSCNDLSQIANKIKEAKKFNTKEYISNTDNFLSGMEKVLNDLLEK